MLRTLVIDKNKQPLMPCHPARARQLLKKGKAKVFKLNPFTIILQERDGGETQKVELKIDPGSKITGMACVADFKRGKRVVFALNLQHRGHKIKEALESRRAIRRSRRHRKCRYRKPRFNNRARPKGWLPPSLRSRLDNTLVWSKRLLKLCHYHSIVIETVRFDTQKMQNPEINGTQYQQGELAGYEVREYLLEKWGRACVYCGKKDRPLEVEHIVAKSRGGSNRVSNLTLACTDCNLKKSNHPVAEFVKDKAKLAKILAKAKAPLKDTSAVNATRYAIREQLSQLDVPISSWSGGRTKFNRQSQGYLKKHWIDAACTGETGRKVYLDPHASILTVKAEGRGSRQKCRVNKYGFPRTSAKSLKRVLGFQTGDIVKAIVPKGKKQGTYTGRVAVRLSGSFNIKLREGSTIQGINARYCKILQRSDGYSYSFCI